ncbi:PRTRC system protein F [Paraburkholderia gardini]|uniref:PRTRC system protein F n=1 Tax=Paraburkholderia gardini TaxID=2823469 RepID=UPI001E649869|nr:PRTRC system protein F [Paraburkholderia gardini]
MPSSAQLRWRTEAEFGDLVRAQFMHGPLRAADVSAPMDAGDAFSQAFFAWMRRQLPRCSRLNFRPQLLDTNAVLDTIAYQYSRADFEPKSPLHLGFELPEENVYRFRDAGAFQARHSLFVPTMLSLIERASYKTVFVRTPGWFLAEFACWHWQGEENCDDTYARELMEEYFGESGEEIERNLPSAVRPEIYPDELRSPVRIPGRRRRASTLSEHELLQLRRRCSGVQRRVCTELIALTRLLRRAGRRNVLHETYDADSLCSACAVTLTDSDRTSEILDDHFENKSQEGEATYYTGFSPFASTPGAIRRQYADWTLAFEIIAHLDRLLAMVTI